MTRHMSCSLKPRHAAREDNPPLERIAAGGNMAWQFCRSRLDCPGHDLTLASKLPDTTGSWAPVVLLIVIGCSCRRTIAASLLDRPRPHAGRKRRTNPA